MILLIESQTETDPSFLLVLAQRLTDKAKSEYYDVKVERMVLDGKSYLAVKCPVSVVEGFIGYGGLPS